MNQSIIQSLVDMVVQSNSPIVVFDDNLKFIACSNSFFKSVCEFSGDIHDLFDANGIQRIKRSRRYRKPLKISTSVVPFGLDLYIDWLTIDDNHKPFLFGIIQGNHLHDANHSISMIYSLADHSKEYLNYLRIDMESLKQLLPNDALPLYEHACNHIKTLQRNFLDLHHSVELLSDDLVLDRRVHDIKRIVRTGTKRAQELIEKRNIRIRSHLPDLPVFVNCDRKKLSHVIARCLYCLLYFTQDNARILIDMSVSDSHCCITFTDPMYKIPEEYAERIMLQDVITPDQTDHAGLYFAYAVTRKHNGILSLDNTPPLGYTIKLELPLAPPHIVIFEDYDDSIAVAEILKEVDLELFDL